MSAFIASGPPPNAAHINTDPFWPSIDLDALRAALRIDASVTPARLETAAIAAAISVNRTLAKWRNSQVAAGYATLTAVPAGTVQGTSELTHLYGRAIQAATAAEVCERYRSYDSTAAGDKKAEDLQTNIDDYRRDQRWAISDLQGTPRMTVELI
jgi:hypothetical protein